ncbi:MAG: ABC transporter permease [Firmicutes bacterium]|nr:ABC transporter permease [Bacillota bacterium]
MGSYIIRRLLYFIPTVLLISVISFVVINAPPGDILTSQIEELEQQYGAAAERQVQALRERYGLDEPLYKRYFTWMKGIILRGDFGMSFSGAYVIESRPVKDILLERLPYTVLISLLTLFFTWATAIPIAVYSAARQHSFFDYFFTFIAFVGRSTPNFLLALVLMYIGYVKFGWSLGGMFSSEFVSAPWSWARLADFMRHLVVPVIVIGTAGMASIVRVLRATMLDELGKDYVETARAKGVPEWRVIWTHPTKVALLPIISTIGWLLPGIFSGSTVTAIVLNLPTIGLSMYTALRDQDMYLAGSCILVFSVLTVIGTLLSDILLATMDPRIRYD